MGVRFCLAGFNLTCTPKFPAILHNLAQFGIGIFPGSKGQSPFIDRSGFLHVAKAG